MMCSNVPFGGWGCLNIVFYYSNMDIFWALSCRFICEPTFSFDCFKFFEILAKYCLCLIYGFWDKVSQKRQNICMPQKDYRGKDFHRQILRRTGRKTGQSLKWPNVSKKCDHERTQKRIEALGRTKPVAVDNKFYKALFLFLLRTLRSIAMIKSCFNSPIDVLGW